MSESNNSEDAVAAAGSQQQEIQKLSELADKWKNDYLYLRAEFDNYKKHAIKERSDLVKFGSERLARDLLTVLDNFERALNMQVGPDNYSQFVKGVELTAVELKSALQKHGIQEFPSQSLPFDPSCHEALSSEPTDEVPEGHVYRVFQKAYKYHDKVIRPAHVVVAKKPGVAN